MTCLRRDDITSVMAAALGNAEKNMDLMRRMKSEERTHVYAFSLSATAHAGVAKING